MPVMPAIVADLIETGEAVQHHGKIVTTNQGAAALVALALDSVFTLEPNGDFCADLLDALAVVK